MTRIEELKVTRRAVERAIPAKLRAMSRWWSTDILLRRYDQAHDKADDMLRYAQETGLALNRLDAEIADEAAKAKSKKAKKRKNVPGSSVVERGTVNPDVAGSSPAPAANGDEGRAR